MKISSRSVAIQILSLVACFDGSLKLNAQGPLTPPGPPAPSMHTLDQLGPRIPLESVALPGGGYSITAPGSYFASGMLSSGINVSASNVTIDFNGFGIVASSGPTVAVYVDLSSPRNNLKICNGSISGPSITVLQGGAGSLGNLEMVDLRVAALDGIGTMVSDGISLTNPVARRVSMIGLDHGLVFQSGGSVTGTITECSGANFSLQSGAGFQADVVSHSVIRDSTVSNASAVITGGTISHTTVARVTVNGTSVVGIQGATVSDCVVADITQSGSGSGLYLIAGGAVRGCFVNRVVGASTSGYVYGVLGASVDGCSISDLTSPGPIIGIQGANNGQSGVISRCVVRSITTQAPAGGVSVSVGGIFAPAVIECDVDSIHCTGAAGVAGIAAQNIRGCRVNDILSFASDLITSAAIFSGTNFSPTGPSLVEHCVVRNAQVGISARGNGAVRNCTVSASAFGILVNSNGVTVDGCNVRNALYGVYVGVDSTSNLVIRNHVSSASTLPYSVGPNVRLGPVVSGAGGVITSSNPWANFAD